jgi:hypothetical protein
VPTVIEPDNRARMIPAERRLFYAKYGLTQAFDPLTMKCEALP